MKAFSILLLLDSFIYSAFAGQSFLNVLNEETGDFGGGPFPLRDQFSTFIETDGNGDVTGYGFYLPKLSNMGIDSLVNSPDPPKGAALDFDKSGLADPSQVPFEFVGINYNPGGHPGVEYLIPHFDFHFWFYPNEFARGIECNGTSFPCATTPWLAQRFAATPPLEFFPIGSFNNPSEWVPTMGAHLVPLDPPDDFADVPAVIIGSYLGKVIFHEPMVSSKILLESELGEKNFPWPKLKYPKPGRYFTNINITYDAVQEKYKILLNQLVVAPEEHRSTGIYMGLQSNPLVPTAYTGSVSGSKDCLIHTDTIVDGGYTIHVGAKTLCCRARGSYDGFTCENNVCGIPQPLVPASPDSYYFNALTGKCYARCVERVEDI